jgi:tetratricopeptide (TPR) repeat protein
MLSTLIGLGLLAPAFGQEGGGTVDGKSNGQPVKAKLDPSATGELERARELHEEGKEQDAIDICKKLEATFRKNEDFDHLVDCLFIAGDAYYALADWPNAEKYMSEAAELGFRYFAKDMSTYPLKVIGESQFEQGKFDEASKTFLERVQKLRKEGSTDELVGALFDAGSILINVDRPQDGLKFLEEALEANNMVAAGLNKKDSGATQDEKDAAAVDHAEIVYHIAVAHFRAEEFEKAREELIQARAFFKSLEKSKNVDISDRLVAVLDDLVLVNEKLGDTKEAEKYRLERDRANQ